MRTACLVPGCPGYAVHRGRCARHRRSTTQRGYGIRHQRSRHELAATLPAPCGYCGRWLTSADRWVAAHVVDGRPEYGYVVACPGCNERAKRGDYPALGEVRP